MEADSAQNLAVIQAQFAELQKESAGLTVEIPEDRRETDVTDPAVYARIEDTRSQVEDLALPVDTSYKNFESGQQVANPTEDFGANPLIADTQDSTRQRISSLKMPDVDFPPDYSGS